MQATKRAMALAMGDASLAMKFLNGQEPKACHSWKQPALPCLPSVFFPDYRNIGFLFTSPFPPSSPIPAGNPHHLSI